MKISNLKKCDMMYDDIYEEMMEKTKPLDAEKVSASIEDVFRFLLNYEELLAESEADGDWFEMHYDKNEIVIKKCSKSYSIEQGGFNDPINYNYYNREILRISATAEEYINMLTHYIMRKQELKMFYSHIMGYLHFTTSRGEY